jgi:hypothetical protein
MIVSNAEHVCLAHAIEFWTGLLGYARNHRGCCVKLGWLTLHPPWLWVNTVLEADRSLLGSAVTALCTGAHFRQPGLS